MGIVKQKNLFGMRQTLQLYYAKENLLLVRTQLSCHMFMFWT